jgi:hypothetical protein
MSYPGNAIWNLKNFRKFVEFNVEEYLEKLEKKVEEDRESEDYL